MNKFISLCLFVHILSCNCFSLDGFVKSKYWDEQLKIFKLVPEINVEINAPSSRSLDEQKETTFIFYTLPNGNTINETVGKKNGSGVDWHYEIQQIGAQTRELRQVFPQRNWIVCYLMSDEESWPSWRAKHKANQAELIHQIVLNISNMLQFAPLQPMDIILNSHSGGGGFIFGLMDGVASIPSFIQRISFIDSDYDYDDSLRYGDLLMKWLLGSSTNHLSVICYDDRNITIDGKNITCPTCGTWRHTHSMINKFKQVIKVDFKDGLVQHYWGLDGRFDVHIHTNPKNIILHTELVRINGYIQGITSGTQMEGKAGVFWGAILYTKWIQSGD